MKITVADLIAEYFTRHPEPITLNDLLEVMNEEGCELNRSSIQGGMKVLMREGYAGKAEHIPFSYKPIKSGYVSKTQTATSKLAKDTQKRYARQAIKEAKELAENKIRYQLICGAWLGWAA